MSVPARFVHIGFSFDKPPFPITALENVFKTALDWIRYDQNCWILYTNTELNIWRDRIRKTVQPQDSFLLVEFDTRDGYMEQNVWNWLNKSR